MLLLLRSVDAVLSRSCLQVEANGDTGDCVDSGESWQNITQQLRNHGEIASLRKRNIRKRGKSIAGLRIHPTDFQRVL